MQNTILDIGKLLAQYYSTNQLSFDLIWSIDHYIIPYDIIDEGNYRKIVLKNNITNQYIAYTTDMLNKYDYTHLQEANFKYNYLTDEYYAIYLHEISNNQKLKYSIVDIYSLQSKNLIANFVVNIYSYQKSIISSKKGNSVDVIFESANKYVYTLCAEKLIRWKIKNLNIYSYAKLTQMLLKTIPLFIRYTKDDSSTIVYNYTANEKIKIPFELIDIVENMFYIKLNSYVYALINPFTYNMYLQLKTNYIARKILTKVLV